jgi:hypothetical protein
MSYWWFSFVDPNAEGDKCRGACIVVADSFETALTETILRGCNAGPHTELEASEVPKVAEHDLLSKFPINKLISKKELNDEGVFSEYERRHSHH